MTPPMPSINVTSPRRSAARHARASASNGIERCSRAAAMSGDNGAAKRHGLTASRFAASRSSPCARSSNPVSLLFGLRGIEARGDGLQRPHAAAHGRELVDEPQRHERLADARARRRDEDRRHARSSGRTAAASAATCSAVCAAENVTRSRDVPGGTVGGRIAATRKPAVAQRRARGERARCAAHEQRHDRAPPPAAGRGPP